MKLSLVVAMVDDDKTDAVIDAARAGGATGATIIKSVRGEGLREQRSFLGLKLGVNRDVLLFLVAEPRARAERGGLAVPRGGPGPPGLNCSPG